MVSFTKILYSSYFYFLAVNHFVFILFAKCQCRGFLRDEILWLDVLLSLTWTIERCDLLGCIARVAAWVNSRERVLILFRRHISLNFVYHSSALHFTQFSSITLLTVFDTISLHLIRWCSSSIVLQPRTLGSTVFKWSQPNNQKLRNLYTRKLIVFSQTFERLQK